MTRVAMRRSSVNGKDIFREATDAYVRDFEGALRQRRHEMESAWEEIDEGWATLEITMTKLGFRPADNASDSILKLNIGGAPLDLWRSSLTESEHARQSKLGKIFNGVWDKRLPTTCNGRVVLDESPSCFKHLMNALLDQERSSAIHDPYSAFKCSNLEVVDPCDEAYMNSLEQFLQLNVQEPEAMMPSGGGRILAGKKSRVMLHQLKGWLTSTGANGMNLLYQASRDGFTPESFHVRCDGAESTVTLFEVHDAAQSFRSVVGGYSGTSWAPRIGACTYFKESPDSFIFLLKDGRSGESPKNWLVGEDLEYDYPSGANFHGYQAALFCSSTDGPVFGVNTLGPGTRNGGSYRSLCVQNTTYNHKNDHSSAAEAFLALNGALMAEMEVYSLDTTPSAKPAASGYQRPVASTYLRTFWDNADTHTFGTSIAGCLARERLLLDDAESELDEAKAMVKATANALEDIYGPHVAAGKEDTVVELNVRGKSMTTLVSTLQACPDSALATRFNSERWPPSEKDLDAHGRYVVDCDPVCFSKILDVLRIRKRKSWSPMAQSKQDGASSGRGEKSDNYPVGVVVPGIHREAFSALVDMLFPGNEGFIKDLVKYQQSAAERELN